MALQFLNDGVFTGKVGIGTNNPAAKLEVTSQSQTLSTAKFDSIELQTYTVNNSWVGENLYYDGSFKYRANGYATALYFNGSRFDIRTAPNGSAGTVATLTTRFTILESSGNVGIGTDSPVSAWLSGFDPSTGNGTFKLTSEGWIVTPYLTGLAGYYPGQGARPIVWADDSGTNIQCWDNTATDGISLRSSNGTTRLFVKESGDVGIGTNSPSSLLNVNSSANTVESYLDITSNTVARMKLGYSYTDTPSVSDNDAWVTVDSTGNLDLSTRGNANSNIQLYTSNGTTHSEKMRINGEGNVGIGTGDPQATLHVRSANNVTGSIEIEGGKATVTAIGEINSELNFGSRDASATGGIGGSIKSVTESTNGSTVGLAFYTADQQRTPVLEEAMRITKAGNVGIGTDNPTARLNLKSEGTNKYVLRATRSSNGNDLFGFYEDGGGNCELYLRDSASTAKILINGNGDSYFNGGDVGIGTTNPGATLQVGDGASGDNLRVLYSDGAYTEMHGYGLQFNRATSYIRPTLTNAKTMYFGTSSATWNLIRFDALQYDLQTNGVSRLKIDGTGKVGIGVTSPQAALNVNGNIKIEGTGAVWLGGGGSTPDWEIKASTNDLTIADIAGNDGSVFFDNSYGVALPRLTTTQINAMPASVLTQGLMAYNITLNTICFYNGSSWQKVSHSNM